MSLALLATPPAEAVAYRLPTIPYLRLRCTLRSQGQAVLPPYKGSLLRGAFGHALRALTCAMGPGQECRSCRLRHRCFYTRLFETLIEGEPPPFLRGLPTSPRPYVFEPADETRVFAPGDPLDFDLLLFGQAAELEAYALLAIEKMALRGLGRGRFPFVLDRVSGPAAAVLPPAGGPVGGPIKSRAVLRFLTPTRLKADDHLLPSTDFRGLVFTMLRRALEIAHFHVPGAAIDWTFRPLLQKAGTVRVTDRRLRWHDWERYSNRQQTRMTLGGFVGEMEIEGDLEPFLPLLRTAEVLHVGKSTTFGLGRMEIG